MHKSAWRFFALAILIFNHPAFAQSPPARDPARLDTTLERLALPKEPALLRQPGVERVVETLAREPCDQIAIDDLSNALQKAGYRREAANAYVGFSSSCNGQAAALRRAVNILLLLSDYVRTEEIAGQLIALEPFADNGYFLRAVANDRGNQPRKAIDDYITAIELFPHKDRIASASYFGLARNYEKLAQYCDAISAVDSWVALNPITNDTGQTRAMISSFAAKGKCATAGAGKVTIPIARRGQVITVSAMINGTKGVFILDTGATFVSLKRSFAQKAKVEVDETSNVRVSTANGIAVAKRGRARRVALKSLTADDVSILVQNDKEGSYGDKVDGLLGLSFLSRFIVHVDQSSVQLTRREQR